MAVITRGWLDINKTYSREKAEEMVAYMKRSGIRLIMIGTQVSQPDDLIPSYQTGDVTIDAQVFIENEDDAIYFALKYL